MEKGFYLDEELKKRLPSLQVNYPELFDAAHIKGDFLKLPILLGNGKQVTLYHCIAQYLQDGTLNKSYLTGLNRAGITILTKLMYISVFSPIWHELFWEEPLKGARWFMQEMKAKYFPMLPIGKMHGAAYCLKIIDLIEGVENVEQPI